jgi:hypothetical protein
VRYLLFVITILLSLVTGCFSSKMPLPKLEKETEEALIQYIEENYRTPEEYIISKFEDHSIVFVGEFHRIKHDVELIHRLIPLLYQSGIYNLGIEFANYKDQKDIDQLITAETYDQMLANKIQFNNWPFWGFQEYTDIFYHAWKLNSQLPNEARKFRVVGLNAKTDWSHVKTEADRQNPEIMKKVMPEGDGDLFMAQTIIIEFLEKGEKALIFCGINHAYTKYKEFYIDEKTKEIVGAGGKRMGNIIYDKIKDQCCTIFLHSPWPSKDGYSAGFVYPADGYIDALFKSIKPNLRYVGFDTVGSPFGDLPGETSIWTHGHEDFSLKDYCDGYIYQKPLSQYEGVSLIKGFINEENRIAAISQNTNPPKNYSLSVSDLIDSLRKDVNMRKRFRMFH